MAGCGSALHNRQAARAACQKAVDPVRYDIGRGADMVAGKSARDFSAVKIEFDRFRPGPCGFDDESCRWIDLAGSSDGGKDCAVLQVAVDLFHVIGHLSEPDDVRACCGSAAVGAHVPWRHFGRGRPAMFAAGAQGSGQNSVHVDRSCAGLFVQSVHVLRDYDDVTGPFFLKPRERVVGGIGRGRSGLLTAGVVKGVDKGGIAGKALWCGHVLDPVLRPKPAFIAKGAQPAFRRQARPSQYDDLFGHHGSLAEKCPDR